ncbi:MAG: LamG domain-containing protein [Dehalococcoidales bacterium]|nr:LamG domain-containing protein [Dehalococcoidales bacterium]
MKRRKLLFIIVLPVVLLISTGVALGLNGFFGGGGSILADTFARGLVGYWSFDEGSGSIAYDASGNGNDGILTNEPTWAAGKIAGALELDGTNDYAVVSDNDALDPYSGSLTISTWVYLNNISSPNRQIVSKEIWVSNTHGYLMQISSGNVSIKIGDGTNAVTLTSDTDLNTNTWYHLVAVFDRSGDESIYINGALDDASSIISVTGDINPSAPFYIGIERTFTNYFSGKIDEVRIYNRALSATEVRYHYNRGGPVAQWKMDEGNGTTIYDSTENNNDGTLYGEMATSTLDGSGWIQGKYGSALAFDGTNDYINCGSNSVLRPTDNITIGVWVNPASTQSNYADIISNHSYGYALEQSSSNLNQYYFEYWNGSAWQGQQIKTTLTADTWQYFVVQRDGSTIRHFVNGVQTASGAASGDFSYSGLALTIGRMSQLDQQYFKGLLDDIRIYDYARTPEEIRLDYNAGFGAKFGYSLGSCSRDPASCMSEGLVGHWDFEERSGTAAYDSSDYANHGTLGDGPTWTNGIKPLTGGESGGGAIQLDGVDDYVHTDENLSELKAFTVEAWIKTPGSADFFDTLVSFNGGGVPIVAPVYTSGRSIIALGSNNYKYFSHSPVNIDDNNWHHVVFVVIGNNQNDIADAKMYADGMEQVGSSISKDGAPVAKTNIVIGEYSNLNFLGLIDEVKVYNRALSAEEVRYHYNRGGPVAHWKMDEGEGRTVYDSTPNNNDGTLVLAGSATSSAWVSGKYGSALNFDGSNDYVDAGNGSSLTITGALTVEAWIKADSFTCDTYFCQIVDKYYSEYHLRITNAANGQKIQFYVNSGSIAVTGKTPLSTKEWHHVVAVFSPNNYLKVYLDGVEDGAKTTGVPASTNSSAYSLLIGRRVDIDGAYFEGLIDDVRIYNYARTAEQIRQDYNAGLATKLGPSGKDCSSDPASCMSEGLVGYWDFEERSGTTAYDSSDYANTGTLTLGPSWVSGVKPLAGGAEGGSALSFDGTNDYVDCGNGTSLGGMTQMSIEYWVKPPAYNGTNSYILYHGYWDTGYGTLIYRHDTSNKIKHCFRNTAASAQCFDATYTPNEWTHMVMSWDGNQMFLYKNAVYQGDSTGPAGGTITPQVNLKFGRYTAALGHFDGLIDEVHIYNRALSAEEVRYHYNKEGPVAEWRMDEGEGGTVYDSTPNNNDGTLVGSAISSAWVEGKYGSALSFDGVNDYVNVADNTIFNNNSITVSAWVYVKDWTMSSTLKAIVQYYYPDTTPSGYSLYLIANNGFSFTARDGIIPGKGVQVTGYSLNTWYYLTGEYDYPTGTLSLYVDGVLVDSDTMVGPISYADYPTNMQLKIGEDYITTAGRHFNGLIDDVRIYNYARTLEQIRQDYNTGLSTYFK